MSQDLDGARPMSATGFAVCFGPVPCGKCGRPLQSRSPDGLFHPTALYVCSAPCYWMNTCTVLTGADGVNVATLHAAEYWGPPNERNEFAAACQRADAAEAEAERQRERAETYREEREAARNEKTALNDRNLHLAGEIDRTRARELTALALHSAAVAERDALRAAATLALAALTVRECECDTGRCLRCDAIDALEQQGVKP